MVECSGGICVSKALCPNETYNFNLSKENSLITLRIDDTDECENYLQICCKHEVDDIMEPPPSTTYGEVCGQTNENGLFYNLHTNETVAQYGEFPWVAYVATVNRTTSSTYAFVCGGTLIHPWHVLTTAHNVEGKTNLIVRFGEWDIGTDKEPYPHQDVDVEIIMHPKYKRIPIQNDIALLVLENEVLYQPHIQPICLPQETDTFDGQRCISNGWGTVQGTYAAIMKKINLPVVPRARCERMLQDAGLGPFYRLRQEYMCAGGESNVDTCKGDGGSPLACKHANGSFVLAGIVSWGIGCGGYNRPGAYVSVNQYLDWIYEQIERTIQVLKVNIT
ncbi:inactive CLIP domain-containing serine protease A28-like [Anopheles coustani]|uniref:inactive CLIP domain-containing serine protease A28-like n=1 Tax=Anopheles coustani TaxID=139045 RepID=UPI00265A5F86|nr:inactive CLIP domain-containing serine protease A28-like [Anopheles coustani]